MRQKSTKRNAVQIIEQLESKVRLSLIQVYPSDDYANIKRLSKDSN